MNAPTEPLPPALPPKPEEYLVTIHNDARGKWNFRFQGRLSWWRRIILNLAGWEVRDVE